MRIFDTISVPDTLDSDFELLSQALESPSSSSHDYVQVVERDGDKINFNIAENANTVIQTKEITVSGVTLILENTGTDPLFERLHAHPDIARLTLCADTVVIRSPLVLRGADVTIFARILRFEGEGSIDTSPKSVTANSTEDVGHRGENAGSFYLNVKEILAPGERKRLLANGAAGQPGRIGERGADGKSAVPWDGTFQTSTFWGGKETLSWEPGTMEPGYTPVIAIADRVPRDGNSVSRVWNGDPVTKGSTWPTDGSPPVTLPGRPGRGGSGGDVYSHCAELLGPRTRQDQGDSGDTASGLEKSTAGTPVKSCKVQVGWDGEAIPHLMGRNGGKDGILNRRFLNWTTVLEKRETKDYPAVAAPEALAEGDDRPGEQRPLTRDDSAFWVHPLAVHSLLAYVNDAFRAGDSSQARALVDPYLAAIGGIKDEAAEYISLELISLMAELRDLAQQIDGPLDYFGNPPGWIPALSFNSNLVAFRSETRDAMARLYLSYWMEHNQAGTEVRAKSIRSTLAELRREAKQAIEDYNTAQKALIDLKVEYTNLVNRIATTVQDIADFEDYLREVTRRSMQAEATVRAVGRILGGIAQVVPVGQPALGAAGQALSALANFEGDDAWDAVQEMGKAAWDSNLVEQVLIPKAEQLGDKLKGALDIKTADKPETEFDKGVAKDELSAQVKAHIKRQSEAKKDVVAAFGSLSVSADEIEDALKKALAAEPEYQKFAETLKQLNADKTSLCERLLATAHALDESATAMVTNRLTEIELRGDLAVASATLSPEALRFTRAMGERALERLHRWQYYFVQSYGYLWLEQVPKLDANQDYLVKRMAEVLTPSAEAALSGDQFDRLCVAFEENLKTIADHLLTFYNTVLPSTNGERVTSKITIQLNARQLRELNETQRLRLDLMNDGLVHLSLEEVRIFDVVVTHAKLQNPPDGMDVRLRLRHGDASYLRHNARQFRFRNTARTWQTTVSHANGKTDWSADEMDAMDESLIRELLGTSESKSPLRTRPSLWGPLTLERKVMRMVGDYPGHFDELTIEVRYTSRDVASAQASLFLSTPPGLRPPISCSPADLSGRGDGAGSFLRTFAQGSEVTLTAPLAYGAHSFAGWTTQGQSGTLAADAMLPIVTPESAEYLGDPGKLIAEPKLVVTMEDHRLVKAIYLRPATARVPDDPASWPQGPEGWVLHDWLFVNESDEQLEITKIDYNPWAGGSSGHGVKVDEPIGNAHIKLSLSGLKIASGEALKFSLFTNPEREPPDGHMIQFVFTGAYSPIFDARAQVTSLCQWRDNWADAGDALAVDNESRVLRYFGVPV
jgi:hypothetical protein